MFKSKMRLRNSSAWCGYDRLKNTNRPWELHQICNLGAHGTKVNRLDFDVEMSNVRVTARAGLQRDQIWSKLKSTSPECVDMSQWKLSQLLITGSTWHYQHFEVHGLRGQQGHRQRISCGDIPIDSSPSETLWLLFHCALVLT